MPTAGLRPQILRVRTTGRASFRENGEVNCELRAATTFDEPFLWEMLYLALFVRPGEPPHPRSVLSDSRVARYVKGWGTRAGDSGFIAVVDGTPVGAAWLRCFSSSEPGYGFVDERTPELTIAIVPAWRVKGIGSLLMERLLQRVRAASLSCDPANPAWRLYLRFGFEPLPDGRTMLRTRPPFKGNPS